MDDINILGLIDAAEKLSRRCVTICNSRHGSAWLLYKIVRFFEHEQAAQSITIPVFINAPVMHDGEATIYRDGALEMRLT